MTIPNVVDGVAGALRALVPEGVTVHSSLNGVLVTTSSGTERFPLALNIERRLASGIPPHDAVCAAVLRLLDELQDSLTVSLTTPWPPISGSGRGEFAEPHAEVRDGALYFWFGNDAPVTPVGRVALD